MCGGFAALAEELKHGGAGVYGVGLDGWVCGEEWAGSGRLRRLG